MPRARIPYQKLEEKLQIMYPWPVFRQPTIRTKDLFKGYTPITVYDRTSGNFSPIGYKAMVEYTRFQGTYGESMNPVFRTEMKEVVILLD